MEEKLLKSIKDSITKAEKGLRALRADITKAKDAGIPTADLEKRFTELENKITLLKGSMFELITWF